MGKPTKLKRMDREPVIAPGGLTRLAIVVFILFGSNLIWRGVGHVIDNAMFRLTGYRHHKIYAPPDIQELAAKCVLTDDKEACATAWAWRPNP